MSIRTAGHVFLASSLLLTVTESSTCHPEQRSNVEILVQTVERISDDEARFQVRVTNRSDQPVFLAGIIYESGSRLGPIYLEQQRSTGEGWKIVVPCMDTPPPHIIKLDPAEPKIENLVLKIPLEGVCKERNIRLEGKFRFRLYYFESEEHARAYLKKFLSLGGQEAHTPIALSEPFKIPPYRDPRESRPNH